jgi:hypothetical protein
VGYTHTPLAGGRPRLQLAESAHRDRHKSVELELHKLQAQQAEDHIQLLKLYLAEDFFNNDYNGLQLLLLLTRLTRKAEIIR